MSDQINAKGSATSFTPHPEGQFLAVCVDTIDLGDKVEQFADSPPKLTHKCALVFRTGERNEKGEFIDVSREFTVSMGEKANLRQFLEQWRGKQYTPTQVEEGVPLHKLTGQPATVTVGHKTSGKGRTYANIVACVGVHPKLKDSVPDASGYVRADFWKQRKDDYADGARKLRAEQAPASVEDFDESQAFENEDALPF